MLIGGIQKLTLLDYPGRVAAAIFTFGCNFRCRFCHNPELVLEQKNKILPIIPEQEIFNFLQSRQNLIEGVVITGGEPTIQADLPEFVQKVKALKFLIKIDTNGTNPGMISRLIKEGNVNYWAMDIKAPLEKYEIITGRKTNLEHLEKSIALIKQSGVPYEFRSTLTKELHAKEDVFLMAKLIKGADQYFLQKFVPREKLVDPALAKATPFSNDELLFLASECRRWVKKCEVR